MGINNAVVLDKHLVNHTSPWAQYYAVALSFALFGQSVFTARLPFIVVSLVSLWVLYLLAREYTGESDVAELSVWIASLSVPFILFSYQARYYALTTCAGLCMTYTLLRYMRTSSLRWGIGFVCASIVFFYANYVVFVAFLLSLSFMCMGLALRRVGWGGAIRFVGRLSSLLIVTSVLCVPWFVWFRPFDSRGTLAHYTIGDFLYNFGVFFLEAFRPFHVNNAFPVLFFGGIGVYAFLGYWKSVKQALFFLMLSCFFLAIMTAATLIAEVDTSFVHIRYTMMIAPFFFIASAILLSHLLRLSQKIGNIVFVLYICTNIFTVMPIRVLLYDFVRERFTPSKTPDHEVAKYLQAHARTGETVFVNLDRDHEPLIFELGKQVRFVNRVSLVNTRIFPDNRQIIPRYIYDYRDLPDWIIYYSKRGNDGTFYTFDHRDPPQEISRQMDKYEEIVLPVFFSDMTRPELDLRSFYEIVPTAQDMVYIYKKKAGVQ